MTDFLKIVLLCAVPLMSTNASYQVLNESWRSSIGKQSDMWFKTKSSKKIAENGLQNQKENRQWPIHLWMQQHPSKPKNTNELQKQPQDDYDVTVAQDGSGDFISIQEAINQSKSFPYKRIIINVRNGIYNEKVTVYEWNTKISLIGESKEETIITYDDHFEKMALGRNSTFFTPTLLVEADDFMAKNLTIENSSGPVGQAIALSVTSDRASIVNCRLLGNQDTLYASGTGKQYYKDCYIEGATDFIFGGATAYFENCEIHSKSNSYITAASTPEHAKFGYVFKNCRLTSEEQVTAVYLGRPWRIFAKTVFIECEMGAHIKAEGWHNWSKPDAERSTYYAEFNNSGKGYQPLKRVNWSHQLTQEQAKSYNLKKVLGNLENVTQLEEWYEAF